MRNYTLEVLDNPAVLGAASLDAVITIRWTRRPAHPTNLFLAMGDPVR